MPSAGNVKRFSKLSMQGLTHFAGRIAMKASGNFANVLSVVGIKEFQRLVSA